MRGISGCSSGSCGGDKSGSRGSSSGGRGGGSSSSIIATNDKLVTIPASRSGVSNFESQLIGLPYPDHEMRC